jgi:hypothetical protein
LTSGRGAHLDRRPDGNSCESDVERRFRHNFRGSPGKARASDADGSSTEAAVADARPRRSADDPRSPAHGTEEEGDTEEGGATPGPEDGRAEEGSSQDRTPVSERRTHRS